MSTSVFMAFLLFVVLCSCLSVAHGGDQHGFVVVPTSSFQPEATCSTARVNLERNHSAVSLPLVHRHGPCAPWPAAEKPSFAETLRRDRARWSHIKSRASSWAMASTADDDDEKLVIPDHIGSAVDSLEYVVTVGLGTPAIQQTVLIDTGSDLSWVQCAPCGGPGRCSSQKDPLFRPRRSSSYAPVPCGSDECRKLAPYAGGCTSGKGHPRCRFAILYADGSSTTGVYGRDKLTLTPGGAASVDGFRFGCGQDRRSSGRYDGLLGLGRRPVSLVSQASAALAGAAFSYCLPAADTRSGFLAIGARRRGADASAFAFTPLGRGPLEAPFYVVTLAGIAVGGRRLDLPPSAFAGGMIVDSGKVVTALPSTAYGALRAAFQKAMAAYPLLPDGELETCYNLTGHKNVAVPRVALTFGGGGRIDLAVPHGILVEGCLAFEEAGPDSSVGSLGNVNQRNFEVFFDTSHNKIGFRAHACGNE